MVVAGWSAHRHNGFFIFSKGEGWEYVASIAVAALRRDDRTRRAEPRPRHRARLDGVDGWIGAVIAGGLGVAGAIPQLAICYRPAPLVTAP